VIACVVTLRSCVAQLIGGYIDILLKKRKDAAVVLEDTSQMRGTIGEVCRDGCNVRVTVCTG
jgi:hypothetical protein